MRNAGASTGKQDNGAREHGSAHAPQREFLTVDRADGHRASPLDGGKPTNRRLSHLKCP
jgi:hypothetical protein